MPVRVVRFLSITGESRVCSAFLARRENSHEPAEAIKSRLEEPCGPALGFRNFTHYIVQVPDRTWWI